MVTVILTVYKRTEYLENALKSVLGQTMTNFEIIIADDSGTNLGEPIYRFYEKDKRIIYQPNLKNIGIVGTLIKSIENSKGPFIAIINDDDYWESEFLAKLTPPLCVNSNFVLSFSDHWIINDVGEIDNIGTENNTKLYKRDELETGEIKDTGRLTLVNRSVPLAMASVFRKDAIDLNLLVTDVSGAYDFWIACLLSATKKPFHYESDRLTHYRVHTQMETGRRSIDKQLNMVYIFKSLLDSQLFPDYASYLAEKYSFSLYKVGRDNLYFGQFETARSYFRRAIKVNIDYRYVLSLFMSYFPVPFLEKISFVKRMN